jgi:hypothetical protein
VALLTISSASRVAAVVVPNWRLVVFAIFVAPARWQCGGRLDSEGAVRRSCSGLVFNGGVHGTVHIDSAVLYSSYISLPH